MLRSLLVSLFFFFGPALLLFLLRNLFLMFRYWLHMKKVQQAAEADIIDITPHHKRKPSNLFVIIAITVGIVSAVLVWFEMQDHTPQKMKYIPAHVNEQGVTVPGRLVPAEPAGPAE